MGIAVSLTSIDYLIAVLLKIFIPEVEQGLAVRNSVSGVK